jgi:exodeoxyribonuclease V alpha subunit
MQGSEFPCAIVINHKSHSFMHHRNLLYTAVTRAQKDVILLGDQWGIENCALKQQVDRRNTFLPFLLNEARRPE